MKKDYKNETKSIYDKKVKPTKRFKTLAPEKLLKFYFNCYFC